MGFRFGRRIKILPGVRLNVGLRGISTSIGVRGASVTVGKTGVHGNVGIPGSGLSYRTKLSGSKSKVVPVPDPGAAPVVRASAASDKIFGAIGVVAFVGFLIWLF